MSILQDLDPKYAKIQSPPRGQKSIALLIALISAILGTAWLLISKPREVGDMQEATAKLPLAQTTEKTRSAVLPVPPSNPVAVKVDREATMPEGKTVDAATIRNVSANEVANPSFPLEKLEIPEKNIKNIEINEELVRRNNRNASSDSAKIAKRQPKLHSAKLKVGSRKTNHAQAPVDSDHSPKASKKAAERDIDIISAIVR